MVVEAETGKTNWRDIQNKIRAYSNLFQDAERKNIYGEKSQLFWITITQKRVDEIKFLLRQYGLENRSVILAYKDRRSYEKGKI
jgi:NADPH-dependent ferric siderophore reductase